MQRLPLRAAGDHRPRCAGIHLRRRRREAQAGKAAGGGGGCDLQQLQADVRRGSDVLRVSVGDIDAHDLLAVDSGGRGETTGVGARQHVEQHDIELTPQPPLRAVVHMNCWRDTGSGQGMQAEERQRGGATMPRSPLHMCHVAVISHAAADVRRAGAMLQLAGSPTANNVRGVEGKRRGE